MSLTLFPVWCEIVCAKCHDTTAGQTVTRPFIKRQDMAWTAKRAGWSYDADTKQFTCPKCSGASS